MKVIGLTGGIASGKSTVSGILREKGAYIIDADEISKALVEPGKPAYLEIVKHFGQEILNEDGSLRRKKLGRIVFADKEKLALLNKITHPKIIEEIKRRLEEAANRNENVVVIDAALLIELGLYKMVDEVWLVTIDEKTQLERLLKRDSFLEEKEAKDRIRAQMPQEEKVKYATRIINNSGDFSQLLKQVEDYWRELVESKN
ncbi:dephospho-CoA kinase [Thermovenabulum gondwanense]|uniref:Dephospho-CoA kinase n=1 Tax=Thermovenabulum gondwanense TaxID=520767 RepID=A0A162M672_9FIRM|nr:dephospho-CoA kinase [Thermovenabulum gondwanense]KYO64291.1 Dephospho-CoA kinase [Thermovenabulum gondwanense]